MKKTILALVLFAAATLPASALTISGSAQVNGSYSFTLDGYTVFLLGVDSVERGQTCTIDRRDWDCRAAAVRSLETILDEGTVTCETVFGPDDTQSLIATCVVNDEDVGDRYVRAGFGLAIPLETGRYADAQTEAQAARVGLWQSEFARPSVWRALPMRAPSTRPRFRPTTPLD